LVVIEQFLEESRVLRSNIFASRQFGLLTHPVEVVLVARVELGDGDIGRSALILLLEVILQQLNKLRHLLVGSDHVQLSGGNIIDLKLSRANEAPLVDLLHVLDVSEKTLVEGLLQDTDSSFALGNGGLHHRDTRRADLFAGRLSKGGAGGSNLSGGRLLHSEAVSLLRGFLGCLGSLRDACVGLLLLLDGNRVLVLVIELLVF
jgi:hypothetical protein